MAHQLKATEGGSSSLWWYVADALQHGPVSKEEVDRLIERGIIAPGTLLWSEGMEKWQALSELQTPRPPPLPDGKQQHLLTAEPAPGVAMSIGDPASPGRRFSARMIDFWATALVVGILVGAGLSLASDDFAFWIQRPESGAVFAVVVIIPLATMLDATVYGLFGSTPGKKLLLLRVAATDGRPLTFAEYLRRDFRVWWGGLGAGFPLFSLLAMIYQWKKISAGEPAGYDIGRYRVDGMPLSHTRAIGAGIALGAMFLLIVGLNAWDQEEARKLRQGSSWTNPITLKRIDVPPGWIYSQQKNDMGHTIHTFTAPNDSLITLFGMEEQAQSGRLVQYVHAFTAAVATSMIVHRDGSMQSVGSRQAWIANGQLAHDNSRKMHFSFVERGPQVWRFIAIGTQGRNPDTAKALELRARLFTSL